VGALLAGVKGFGESSPVADNATGFGHSLKRRVEIIKQKFQSKKVQVLFRVSLMFPITAILL